MLTVGVVIPYHNHSEFLEEAVDSLLAQTRLPDGIMIVDDGSKESESQFAARLAHTHHLSYQRLGANSGPSRAKNVGVRESSLRWRQDITVCLDADDAIAPGYIEMMVDALDSHPEALVAYPDVQMIGFEQRVMKAPPVYNPHALLTRPFIVNGAAFRTELWEEIYQYNGEGWDTKIDHLGWEDYLFWLEGLVGVARGHHRAAVHAGTNKFWYLYRRFNRPDRSDGNEKVLWAYIADKMQSIYGVTMPPMPLEWLTR